MVINDEEKNAFTQSVMGDTEVIPTITEADEGKVLTVAEGEAVWAEGGGGGVIHIIHDLETGKINATFNELLQHFNNGEIVLTNSSWDVEGQVLYFWNILTEMVQESNAYFVYFTRFEFNDGGSNPYNEIYYATDPDEEMIMYD